jgi:hypothetical protein
LCSEVRTMNISYLLYQAERPRSAAEQREADVQVGKLAAAIARFGHSLRHAITGTKDPRQECRRPATATASCMVARPQ